MPPETTFVARRTGHQTLKSFNGPMAPKPIETKNALQHRWLLPYVFLAAFNVLAISTSLYFNHQIVENYATVVATDQAWTQRDDRIDKLSHYASEIDAPPNDVFLTKKIKEEAGKTLVAAGNFDRQLAKIRAELRSNLDTAEAAPFLESLARSEDYMAVALADSRVIFSELEHHREPKAAEKMAHMDQKYHAFNEEIDRLRLHTSSLLDKRFQQQLGMAVSMQRYEYLIAAFILVMVCGSTLHARNLAMKGTRDGLELEARVKGRTADLADMNTALAAEVIERKRTEAEMQSYTKQLERVHKHMELQALQLQEQALDLVHTRDKALEANRTKSQFLANMSHELRTPLNAIIGFSEMLQDETFGEINTKQKKHVGNIHTSGRHLLQLINDILDLSKIEAGRTDLDYSECDVANMLQSVASVVSGLAAKKNITLTTEVAEALPPLRADEAKMKQIVYNLLSNAIKFTPERGDIKVVVSFRQGLPGDGTICIRVCDTGIGIKPEAQERIFKEFEQVDSSYGRLQQGTGLGLTLTRHLVELHGGSIHVESEGIEGKGSVFTVEVPLNAGNQVEEAQDNAGPFKPCTTIKSSSIKYLSLKTTP
jgi:signal transduction histidine kinase